MAQVKDVAFANLDAGGSYELPAASSGYQKNAMRIIPKTSPPNVFIGGRVPDLPVVSLGRTTTSSNGNDGLRKGN